MNQRRSWKNIEVKQFKEELRLFYDENIETYSEDVEQLKADLQKRYSLIGMSGLFVRNCLLSKVTKTCRGAFCLTSEQSSRLPKWWSATSLFDVKHWVVEKYKVDALKNPWHEVTLGDATPAPTAPKATPCNKKDNAIFTTAGKDTLAIWPQRLVILFLFPASVMMSAMLVLWVTLWESCGTPSVRNVIMEGCQRASSHGWPLGCPEGGFLHGEGNLTRRNFRAFSQGTLFFLLEQQLQWHASRHAQDLWFEMCGRAGDVQRCQSNKPAPVFHVHRPHLAAHDRWVQPLPKPLEVLPLYVRTAPFNCTAWQAHCLLDQHQRPRGLVIRLPTSQTCCDDGTDTEAVPKHKAPPANIANPATGATSSARPKKCEQVSCMPAGESSCYAEKTCSRQI